MAKFKVDLSSSFIQKLQQSSYHPNIGIRGSKQKINKLRLQQTSNGYKLDTPDLTATKTAQLKLDSSNCVLIYNKKIGKYELHSLDLIETVIEEVKPQNVEVFKPIIKQEQKHFKPLKNESTTPASHDNLHLHGLTPDLESLEKELALDLDEDTTSEEE